MTLETLVSTDIEQVSSLSPVKDADDVSLDRSLAASQFEAIIRAWKGEADGSQGAIPMSPVGDADLDGSLTGAYLGIGNFVNETCTHYTLFNSLMLCSWDCPTAHQELTCPTSPYGNDCITNDILCSIGCNY